LIALDTNVLLRLLIDDDPEQFSRANRFILKLAADSEEGVITDNALAEIVWVLQSRYKATKPEIIDALQVISNLIGVRVASRSRFYGALSAYSAGKGDFADYLLREQAREAGCRAVATFDKALLKDAGFIEP